VYLFEDRDHYHLSINSLFILDGSGDREKDFGSGGCMGFLYKFEIPHFQELNTLLSFIERPMIVFLNFL